jgi:hypothetical protein
LTSRTFLTVGGCGLFVLIMASLHFLRRDLSPMQRGISRYAGGDTLALTTVAFVALAGALLSLAAALRESHTRVARCVIIAATGLALIALTPIGNPSPPRLGSTLHIIGGLVFYAAIARSMLLAASARVDHLLSGVMVVALIVFLLGGAGVPHLRLATGLFQRIIFSIAVLWAVRTATR